MNDLINRQAAIDAIDKLTKKHFDFPVVMHNVRNAIEALPSAQQWIPCSERLPEPNQCVLVSIKGEVDVDWIEVGSTEYGCWYRCMKDIMSVDAWMPLPEPWRGR